jgi:hypothetical protein
MEQQQVITQQQVIFALTPPYNWLKVSQNMNEQTFFKLTLTKLLKRQKPQTAQARLVQTRRNSYELLRKFNGKTKHPAIQ